MATRWGHWRSVHKRLRLLRPPPSSRGIHYQLQMFPMNGSASCVIHWGNVTLPHFTLLDWEVGEWRLPVTVPAVAFDPENLFTDEFSPASGQIGVLAAIAFVRTKSRAAVRQRISKSQLHH